MQVKGLLVRGSACEGAAGQSVRVRGLLVKVCV